MLKVDVGDIFYMIKPMELKFIIKQLGIQVQARLVQVQNHSRLGFQCKVNALIHLDCSLIHTSLSKHGLIFNLLFL